MGKFLMPEEEAFLRCFEILVSIIQNVEVSRFEGPGSWIFDGLKLLVIHGK
jgi:hypothetical protein